MLRPLAAVLVILTVATGVVAAPSPAVALPPTAGVASHVLINEVANGDAGSDSNSFVELRNWGDAPADLTGWKLFRCSPEGLRSNVGRPEGDLTGIVLAPGAILTISRIGVPGQIHVTEPFGLTGFGMYLESPGGALADRVGVYPNEPWPTQSECTPAGGNLPNVLDFARNESWQRVSDLGDPARDFVVAPSTPGAANARHGESPASTGVVIAEIAGAGPGGAGDEFVELRNDRADAVDIGGWTLDRCTASGRIRTDTRELTIPDGTQLRPGATWVIGGPGFGGSTDATLSAGLADIEFGVMLRTASDELADRVAVSAYGDSACQSESGKLPAILDAVAGESWQRRDERWIIAERTPGAANRTNESSVFRSAAAFAYEAEPGVAISEIATDPTTDGMPAGSVQRNWIELGNYGERAVDIGGWTVRRCQRDGSRAVDVQFTIAAGTMLAPEATYLAARAGTQAADAADAVYDVALNFLGTGVWVADADGRRIDSAGIYAINEMDGSLTTDSPCTKGTTLTTYQPDRLLGQTFQRSQFTGVDADDFLVGEATPGAIDLVDWVDPLLRVAEVDGPGTAARAPRSGATGAFSGRPLVVRNAWGDAAEAPLTTLAGEGEHALDPAAPGPVSDGGYLFPYQRLVIDARDLPVGSTLSWSGSTEPRHEVQVSVWNAGAWRLVGAASSEDGAVRIEGPVASGDVADGILTLLIQDGPRTLPTVHADPDGVLENPGNYDLALSHITDTQYLTESYPEVYAQLVSWIADNAGERKIEFATHTGDLVQNWVDPDQSEDRARREFARASAAQAILESADVRTSVLPGNHDNKRGVSDALFNEYFTPARYADDAWYGGSIAPDDNSANFSTFESSGARFLMLSLPYAYGDRELTWAEAVIAAHPDHNVVISTHEHVTPKTNEQAAGHSNNSRWVSHAQDLWDRLIVPNRNVVLSAVGSFPRARADHHRERGRRGRSHGSRAARRLPGVPDAHGRAGDRIPAPAATGSRLRHGRRRHLLGSPRCGRQLPLRLPPVPAGQRLAAHPGERPAVAHHRLRTAGPLPGRGRRVHGAGRVPVPEVGRDGEPAGVVARALIGGVVPVFSHTFVVEFEFEVDEAVDGLLVVSDPTTPMNRKYGLPSIGVGRFQ